MDTYAHQALDATAKALGYDGDVPAEDRPLVMLYALLGMVKGEDVTAKDVHDAWALWTVAVRGHHNHKSLVPFEALSPEVQALDDEYVEAIRRAAAGVLA